VVKRVFDNGVEAERDCSGYRLGTRMRIFPLTLASASVVSMSGATPTPSAACC
jgi:hypothetical protein